MLNCVKTISHKNGIGANGCMFGLWLISHMVNAMPAAGLEQQPRRSINTIAWMFEPEPTLGEVLQSFLWFV